MTKANSACFFLAMAMLVLTGCGGNDVYDRLCQRMRHSLVVLDECTALVKTIKSEEEAITVAATLKGDMRDRLEAIRQRANDEPAGADRVEFTDEQESATADLRKQLATSFENLKAAADALATKGKGKILSALSDLYEFSKGEI